MQKKEKSNEEKIVLLHMDEIMKMLFQLSDELTIRMINSLFHKQIPLHAKVVIESNEIHRFSELEQAVNELYVDMLININGERFHIEFQTVNDTLMPVRMFEYGFTISIQEVKSCLKHTDKGIRLIYPNQYVIFVEEDHAIPKDELTMKVILWDGDEKEYRVPLLRYWEETTDSLEKKHLEPLLPLQVFHIRKKLDQIANSSKSESEKERLIEEKLREVIKIYQSVSEKIHELTDGQGRLTLYDARQMLNALQHLSAYLYSKYGSYHKIEKEAVSMVEAVFSFDKGLREGEKNGWVEHAKETAYEMFMGGEKIEKIRKYSKLSDKHLGDVLKTMPQTVQSNYKIN